MIGRVVGFLGLAALCLHAETGYDAWLRYERLPASAAAQYVSLPAVVYASSGSEVVRTAESELTRGMQGMLGRTLRIAANPPSESAILLATFDELSRVAPSLPLPASRMEGTYLLKFTELGGQQRLVVAGAGERGVLYGVFALLRHIALYHEIRDIDETSSPYVPVRWTNEWNNLNGTIERGYAGPSIFFANDHVVQDLTRASDYARLLASIGINGCTVNNVNANPKLISSEYLPELARLAAAFRPWGVRVSVAVDFSMPKSVGGLDTFDPLDPKVAAYWKNKVDEVYRAVPDLGGFVLKADSEGRLGPSAYGRTHADAANVLARALKPHGGILLYRGFVYDHHMDWRNLKNDRARAAYDNFKPLDGKFDDNVLIQIKHGPIDFQAREPVSPVFSALSQTNEAIELQITQEYTGQQRHLVYLAPMWKQALDFDLRLGDQHTPVREIVSGRSFGRTSGGFIGVSNVGADANWLGHDLVMSNLYSFGRLAWNPMMSPRTIADEWTRMTWGHNAQVVDTVMGLEMESWPAYERYTGPLGAGTLTDIIHVHFGPGVESSERNGWGQWHRADEKGIGMDRTAATGTGYIAQYPPAVAARFESVERCPDELLLFMHHVPYTHILHSGKTVIQHIYDVHYEGAAEAQTFPQRWRMLQGLVDDQRYEAVLKRLEFQAGHAVEWRDSINQWFQKLSGIPDAKGRVGHELGRREAEALKLSGYAPEAVTPWETASGGKAASCAAAECSAEMTFQGQPGWYDVAVQYFDLNTGAASFRALVDSQVVGSWKADDALPSDKANGHTATRRTIRRVALRPGDTIRIEGKPDGGDRAMIDYVEVTPAQ